MILNYIKTNPTENMTIFILDPLPRSTHHEVARKILGYGSLYAEQVGFIEPPSMDGAGIRLQMMGGEFCGNATRALAALAVHRGYPCVFKNEKNLYQLSVEVSGVPEAIPCLVTPISFSRYHVAAEMPLFETIRSMSFSYDGNAYSGVEVCFPGITHLVLDTELVSIGPDFVEAALNALPIPCEDAFGIMLYNSKESRLTPVVYTSGTNTIVWERGCGSGSAAVIGALCYEKQESVSLDLSQPGGPIHACATWKDGAVNSLRIEGPVSIVSDGTVHLESEENILR